jgi:RNA-binding protein
MSAGAGLPPMAITEKQKRWLKARAHHLKPVVTVGQQGLTEPVLAEIDAALGHHELLKVKIASSDRAIRDQIVESIVDRSGASLVTRIGNVAALYRANPHKRSPLALPAI